jgi:[ribosomal protein S5]-alanine N-acetyltransferase
VLRTNLFYFPRSIRRFRFQRQGFAAEAVKGVLDWLDKELKSISTKAWVDTRNEASIKLLERLRFKKIETLQAADFFKGSSSDEFVFLLVNEVNKFTTV